MHLRKEGISMNSRIDPTKITLWVNRGIAAALFALLFGMPALLDWYSQFRYLSDIERTAITAAFYACAAVVYVALWNMDRLLSAILGGQVFIRENVRRIRAVQWCCGAVGLICIPAAVCYYPLIFMVIIMGFLCLVVSVVCRVMDAAVSIREENDLTI